MARDIHRFRMYQHIAAAAPEILEEAGKVAADLGLTGSGGPTESRQSGLPRDDVSLPEETSRLTAETRKSISEIREIVKDAFGDAYDACPVSSTRAGIDLCKSAVIPFAAVKRLTERAVVLSPRMKPTELLAGCSAIPPKYRLLPEFGPATIHPESARDATEGGRVLAAVVPMAGATYEYHGIAPAPVSMIAGSFPQASLETLAAAAESHAPWLAAVFASGTATPGCGLSPTRDDGIPEFHSGLGELAEEFDVPLVLDDSAAIPFLGPDLGRIGASAAVFGPFGPGRPALAVGTEEIIMPLLHMTPICGKAGDGALYDERGDGARRPILPPSGGLRAMARLLKEVRENPERYTRLASRIYDIVTSEFAPLGDKFKTVLRFHKNYAALSVEVNYEDTWDDGQGFPIFSSEDGLRGTHLLREGLKRMGIANVSISDASITFGPPREALELDPAVSLDPEQTRLEARALVALLRIIGKRAGYPM